jgi:spectrin alpha
VANFNGQVEAAIANGHYSAETLKGLVAAITGRLDQVNTDAAARRARLEALLRLLRFEGEADEVDGWLAQQLEKATDGSYKDASNLRGKLRAHKAIQLTIDGYGEEVGKVLAMGAALVDEGHYAAESVVGRTAATQARWVLLGRESADKGNKLSEAVSEQSFYRFADDLDQFCDEAAATMAKQSPVETHIEAEEQLKKHDDLSTEIVARRTVANGGVDELGQLARELTDAGNFRAAEVSARQATVTHKYEQLLPIMHARHETLEAEYNMQLFLSQAKVEMDWNREQAPIASSEDKGNAGTVVSIFGCAVGMQQGAKQVVSRHNVFDAELNGHADIIQNILDRGNALIATGAWPHHTHRTAPHSAPHRTASHPRVPCLSLRSVDAALCAMSCRFAMPCHVVAFRTMPHRGSP